MSRVFCVGELKFPNGSASANYVEYLSLALAHVVDKVVVISTGNSDESLVKIQKLQEKNVYFSPIILKQNIFKRHFQVNYNYANCAIALMKSQKINNEDVIITYNTNPFTLYSLLRFARKNGIRICGCITERMSRDFFAVNFRGKLEYKKYLYATEHILPKYDLVFPISTYLKKYYENMGAKTMLIPILANAEENSFYNAMEYKQGVKKLIFPGNGKIKDNLTTMLNAFDSACKSTNTPMELHLTGIKRERIVSLYPKIENMDNVVIHGWMDYDELVQLYWKMDFLLIARDTSQTTLANFPSKVPEVMCYGVIPVVSRVGDYTSMFLTDGKDSLIFDGSNEQACKSAILRAAGLTRKEMKKISQCAYQTVCEKMNLKAWGTDIWNRIMEIQCNNEE